jgi:hypothetical protein
MRILASGGLSCLKLCWQGNREALENYLPLHVLRERVGERVHFFVGLRSERTLSPALSLGYKGEGGAIAI